MFTHKKSSPEITSPERASLTITTVAMTEGNTMKNKQNYFNSTVSQRNRLLEYLRTKPLTTVAARDELDIMHPAGRVQELKAQGHNIHTHWEIVDTGQGKHRVASYVLLSGGAHA